jgi:chromosome segregation ATPase
VRPGLADEPKQPVPDAPTKGEPDQVLVFRIQPDQPKQPPGEPSARGRAADPTRTTPLPGRAGAAAIAELKDELELLEAQGVTKQAQVKATEVAVKAAQRKLELLTPLQRTGQVAQGEVIATQAELESAQAQMDVKKAELAEHMVKVKQAKRRLESASRGAAGEGDPRLANIAREHMDDWVRGLDATAKERAKAETDQLRAQFEKLQKQSVDLAAQRNELARQLAHVTAQQEAIAADLQKLKAMIDGQMKTVPDRPGSTPKR